MLVYTPRNDNDALQFIVTIVHTERHGATRIISMRKATRHETRSFFAQITD